MEKETIINKKENAMIIIEDNNELRRMEINYQLKEFIKYINEFPIKPDEYSKKIVQNIIDYVCTNIFNNKKIDVCTFTRKIENSMANFRTHGNKLKYLGLRLGVYNKNDILKSKLFKCKDIDNFLYSYWINKEDEIYLAKARYIFNVLHELGHINDYIIHEKSINKWRAYEDIMNGAHYLLEGYGKTEIKTNKIYSRLQTELFADNFAYRYFYLVWNMLKEQELV